jgi:hypothetical protein
MRTLAARTDAVSALVTTLVIAGATAAAGQTAPTDFARAIEVTAPGPQPIARVTLPETVYTTSVKPGLADLRVFNRAGTAVPHALRRPPQPAPDAETAVSAPIFPLFESPRGDRQQLTQVAIGPRGAVVQLQPAPRQGAVLVAYLVDASTVEGPLARLSLQWESPASESFAAPVSVEGSYDLNSWQPLVSATVARLLSGDQELRRGDIELGGRRARYLRLSWPRALENVRLMGVKVQRESAVPPPPITWTVRSASAGPGGAAEFDTGGRIPVEQLDLELVDAVNAAEAALVTFSSRAEPDAPWQQVRREVVYAVTQGGRTLASPPLRIAPTTDRYWRVEVARAGGWAAGRVPRLKLGWYPDELLFLTQGGGPFTLAYGSARATAEAAPIEALLRGTENASLDDRVQRATLGPSRELGGATALTEPKSYRRVGLWAVLVLAVAGLAALVFRVARDIGSGAPRS